jgi:hypothetical protein
LRERTIPVTGGWHFGAGALAFGTAEAVWLLGHRFAGLPSAWVLKPPSGIVFAAVVLLFASSVMAAAREGDLSWLQSFVFASTGAYGSVIASLFFVGPGNLWPFVLVIDAFIVIPVVFVGALLGDLVRDFRTH